MHDISKLVEAIWNAPQQCTELSFTPKGAAQQSRQRLDGSDGKRADKTILRRGTDKNGEPTIWVNYNGGSYPNGQTIWAYLCWKWNTNDYAEVLERCGDIYGIEPEAATEAETAAYRKKKQQRATEATIRKEVTRCILKAIGTEKYGRTAVDYLTRRGLKVTERMGAYSAAIRKGIIEAVVRNCEGITTAQAEEAVRRFFPTTRKDYTTDKAGAWKDYADSYQLAAPYYTGNGNVMGFWLRCTAAELPKYTDEKGEVVELPKYLYTKDMQKGGYCGTLRHDVPVLLVEGMLDAEAIRQAGEAAAAANEEERAAQYANVVGLGGQTPTGANADEANRSQIKTLQRYQTKKLIYFPDNDYNAAGEPKTRATRDTIKTLLPYVTGRSDGDGFASLRIADLHTADRSVKDAADYLKTYGAAHFAGVISDAGAWYEYLLSAAVQEYKDDTDGLRAEATTIYDSIRNYAERHHVQTLITNATGGYLAAIKATGLNAAALALIDRDGANSTRAAKIADVVDAMQKTHSAEKMGELLAKANRIQNEDTYNDFEAQENATREQLHRAVAEKPDALATPWELYAYDYNAKKNYPCRKISFSPAAVSIIAAPTNHGKTLILLQTAILLAKQTGKRFYYLSVENDAEQLYIRALTAYIGEAWKDAKTIADNGAQYPVKNPRAIVREHIKAQDCPRELFGKQGAIDINAYINKYWQEIAPYLRLIRTTADVEAIINNVTAAVENANANGIEVGGVFVDYLQLLHAPTSHAHSRTDEVKGICDRLNDMAKAIKVPVVLAAQFNRDATKNTGDKLDGVEMANIAESAGIENIAEDCYLVWQIDKIKQRDYVTKQKDESSKFYVDVAEKERSARCFTDLKNYESLRRGYLYVENLKARDYGTGGYCLLPFNGAAGCITSNKSEE